MVKEVTSDKECVYVGVGWCEDSFGERLDDVFSRGVLVTKVYIRSNDVAHVESLYLWMTI